MTVPGGKSRNADFILIAKGDTTTLGLKGRCPLHRSADKRKALLCAG
jgi:hypothetical protein